MKHGGIIAAAIEVLADIDARHRPATEALKDWGTSHRFAGSGDRAAIGNLVFDALRCRASIAWKMGNDTPRVLALGAYVFSWGATLERLEICIASDRHSPEDLTDREKTALRVASLDGAPQWVRGDYPEWMGPSFDRAFAGSAVQEGAALAARAPIDLRINTLKSSRGKISKSISRFDPSETPLSPVGLRVASGAGPARQPHVEAEPGYRKGWFELQDEGSQLAAYMTSAVPGLQVADICAGAGGKTLALAAMMANKGQIYAWDADRRRLAAIHERLQRAGARNVQVRPAGDVTALADLEGKIDLALVDAPCSGTGVWRRRPDAKWRLSEKAVAERKGEQAAALALGAKLLKPGGTLVYVTCSVLPEENDRQIETFLSSAPEYSAAAPAWIVANSGLAAAAKSQLANPDIATACGLQLTPLRTGTDGFYVSVLKR